MAKSRFVALVATRKHFYCCSWLLGCLTAIVAIQLFMGDNNASLAGAIEFHMTRVTTCRERRRRYGGLAVCRIDSGCINSADNNSKRLRSCRLLQVTYLLLFCFRFFSVFLIYLFIYGILLWLTAAFTAFTPAVRRATMG